MFCDEEDTKHISSSQWMKWKTVLKITCQYVPWQCFYSLINVTLSCTCAQHEGVCERGGTTPHIINPVLLHTALTQYPAHHCQYVNLPSPPQHFISYQLNSWLFHSLHILVSIFLWVMTVSINYPQSLTLKGTLALPECVQSASHSTCFTFGENALSTNWRGGWMDQRFVLEALSKLKNPLTLPEPNLNYSIQSTAY